MSTWRLWIGVALILHGVGHLLGMLSATSLGDDGWNARSWLLTDSLGDGPTKGISFVLWMIGLAVFVVAGMALLEIGIPEGWWRGLAVVGSILSLATLALFWNGFPMLFPNKIGAIAVNVTAVVGILVADWPTEEMLSG